MRWGGSKWKRSKAICRWFPYGFKRYVEPFAGLACCYRRLVGQRGLLPSALINDLDNDWYRWALMVAGDQTYGDFIERLATDLERFLPEWEHEDEIRAYFEECKEQWLLNRDPYAWFILHVYGVGQYVNCRHRNNLASFDPAYLLHGLESWTVAKARDWRNKFSAAEIRNEDALELLLTLGPDDFAYLDPPYIPFQRRFDLYVHEMTMAQQERLAEILLSAKFRFVLSIGDNPPSRRIYCRPEFKCRMLNYSYGGHSRKNRPKNTRHPEWLIRNY